MIPFIRPLFISAACLLSSLGASAHPPADSLRRDSTAHTLQDAFLRGRVQGRARFYAMATINDGALLDYYALAAGAALRYETGIFHHFAVGAGGSFTYNLSSSDLTKPDPLTGQPNRYEIGLFDVSEPANKTNLFRLEELYLKYAFKAGSVRLGKQLLNTPFINPQDGRMRPTFVDGVYASVDAGKRTRIEGGYLYGIAPRSTVRWYHVGESIGYYPLGVNPDGSRSNYLGQTRSDGIGLIGITHKLTSDLTVQFWDQYILNICNTALLQADYKRPLRPGGSALIAGAQLIRQDGVGNGGNDSASKVFYPRGGRALVIGGRLGGEFRKTRVTLNYTRITADGRYLMPREWGRDPFYTFLPRERNEGLGDVSACMLSLSRAMPAAGLNIEIAGGHYELPDAKNYALNKYGFPSYNQYNLSVRYAFPGTFRGLDLQALYVYKQRTGEAYGNLRFIDNKVDMSLLNLIVDYRF